MLRVGESEAVVGFRALGDERASPDAPLQQVPRVERPAAEAEGGGKAGQHLLPAWRVSVAYGYSS